MVVVALDFDVIGEEALHVISDAKTGGPPGAHQSVEVATLQHVVQSLGFGDELQGDRTGWGDVHFVAWAGLIVAALEPTDGAEVDPVFVLEGALNPYRGGLPILRETHPFALKVGRLSYPGVGVDEDIAVAEGAGWEHGNRHVRELALGPSGEVQG